MPSAKTLRAQRRRAGRTRMTRSFTRSRVAKARNLIESGDASEGSVAALKDAVSALDRAARKHIIHPNEAARRKSRLQRKLNALTAK